MKIISHHPAHQDEVLTRGLAVINGLEFRPGEGGKPTAEGVTEAQCNLFVGVPGYQFLHDDGQLAGETTLKDKPLGLDAITEALKQKSVTVDEVRAMNLEIPGIGNLNGLIDSLLDPANSRANEGQASPNEQEEQAQIAKMLGVDASQITFDGDNIIVDYPEGLTLSGEAQVQDEDGQEDETDADLSEDPELLERAAQLERGESALTPIEDVLTREQASGEAPADQPRMANNHFNGTQHVSYRPVENAPAPQPEAEPTAETQAAAPAETSKPADDGHGDKAAIKAKLTELGVEFGPRDNRAELVRKLEDAQARK